MFRSYGDIFSWRLKSLMRITQAIPIFLLVSLFFLLSQTDVFSFSWSQTELHHIFPREHSYWFNLKGINPDLWCVPLSREKHTGVGRSVHHHKYMVSGGRNYNDSWIYFIKSNPEASEAECFIFAAKLFSEVGINLGKTKFYNYRTGTLSNVKIPKSKILDRIWPLINRLCRFVGKSGSYVAAATMVYEMFDIVTDIEIPIAREKYISGLDAYFHARELYDAGKYRESRIESMKYCYYMGSLAYEFFRFSQEFSVELRDLLKRSMNTFQIVEAEKIAFEYLSKANSIRTRLNYPFPEIQFELGQMYRFTRKDSLAKTCFLEAEREFRVKGNENMASEARKLFDEIN